MNKTKQGIMLLEMLKFEIAEARYWTQYYLLNLEFSSHLFSLIS